MFFHGSPGETTHIPRVPEVEEAFLCHVWSCPVAMAPAPTNRKVERGGPSLTGTCQNQNLYSVTSSPNHLGFRRSLKKESSQPQGVKFTLPLPQSLLTRVPSAMPMTPVDKKRGVFVIPVCSCFHALIHPCPDPKGF